MADERKIAEHMFTNELKEIAKENWVNAGVSLRFLFVPLCISSFATGSIRNYESEILLLFSVSSRAPGWKLGSLGYRLYCRKYMSWYWEAYLKLLLSLYFVPVVGTFVDIT